MDVPFPLVHRLFYPQVPLVLSASSGGRVSAMPVVSYASLSDTPPLVGVACTPKAFTLGLCVRAKAFTLSLLDREQSEAIGRLATISGAKVRDKLKEAGFEHRTGRKVPAPVLDESVATIECSLRAQRRVGDHVLLIGRVEACYSSEDFADFWAFKDYAPILYTGWRGGMTTYGDRAPRAGGRTA